jgi:hypothetical protein
MRASSCIGWIGHGGGIVSLNESERKEALLADGIGAWVGIFIIAFTI